MKHTTTLIFNLLALSLGACSAKHDISEQHLVQVAQDPRTKSLLDCRGEKDTYSIVNGSEVPSEDPDSKKAVLLVIFHTQGMRSCTGALISERMILTAAHCLKDATQVTAIFSPAMTCASGYDRKRMSIPSEKFLVHESYAPEKNFLNDLALVKLSAPAPANYPVARLYDGQRPLSSDQILMIGYGISDESKTDSLVLRKTTKSFHKEALAKGQVVAFNQAGESGGVCDGDSGGPIYAECEGEDQILGVANRVMGNDPLKSCHKASAAAYVPAYLGWIREHLQTL